MSPPGLLSSAVALSLAIALAAPGPAVAVLAADSARPASDPGVAPANAAGAAATGTDEAAAPARSEATDLIFVPRDYARDADGQAWRLDRAGPEAPQFLPVEDGRLAVRTVSDTATGESLVELHEDAGGQDRVLGRYPVDTGDPALLYFLETVARHVALFTGGSPFYIRNRIKDALRAGATVTGGQGEARKVVLTPFAGDPNAARMAGFDQLTMVFGLDADPKAPIRTMTAEAPAAGYALRLEEVAE